MAETNGKHDMPDPGGNGGLTITDPGNTRHLRRNARDIVRILRFELEDGETVYSEHEIKVLLRGAVPLAAQAIKDKSPRNWAAVMKVILECAKAEQNDKPRKVSHEHSHTLTVDERRSQLAALDDRLGLGGVVDEIPGGQAVNDSQPAIAAD